MGSQTPSVRSKTHEVVAHTLPLDGETPNFDEFRAIVEVSADAVVAEIDEADL
jgi:hypothetical protein